VPITLSGGNTVRVDGTAMPLDVLSGFTFGGTIDLAGISSTSGGSAGITSGNQLQVNEGGNTYSLQLDPAANYSGAVFQLTPDSGSGTSVILEQITTVSSGQTVSNASLTVASFQEVYGTAVGTIVSNGGEQDVYQGGTASGTTVSSSGLQDVFFGGEALGGTIKSAGHQNVSSGGLASGTVINASGFQYVSSCGSVSGTTIIGQQVVFSGGASISAIMSGGLETVSGGTTTATTLLAAGLGLNKTSGPEASPAARRLAATTTINMYSPVAPPSTRPSRLDMKQFTQAVQVSRPPSFPTATSPSMPVPRPAERSLPTGAPSLSTEQRAERSSPPAAAIRFPAPILVQLLIALESKR
jgi:autotransporter passenger strand-loop-strand repeat protein